MSDRDDSESGGSRGRNDGSPGPGRRSHSRGRSRSNDSRGQSDGSRCRSDCSPGAGPGRRSHSRGRSRSNQPRGRSDDSPARSSHCPGRSADASRGRNDAPPGEIHARPRPSINIDYEASTSSSVLRPPLNNFSVIEVKMEVDEHELENTLTSAETIRQVVFCRVVMAEVFSFLNKSQLMRCRAVCRDWNDWTMGFMAEKATLGLSILDRHVQSQNLPDDFSLFIGSLVSIPYKTIRLELTESEEYPRRMDFILDFLNLYGKQITKLVVHIFRIVGSTSFLMNFFQLLVPRLPNLQELEIRFGPLFKLYDSSIRTVGPQPGEEPRRMKMIPRLKTLIFDRKICYGGGHPVFCAQSEAVLTTAIMNSVLSFSLESLSINGTEDLGLSLSRMIIPTNYYRFCGNLVELNLKNQLIDEEILGQMSTSGFPVLRKLSIGDFKSKDVGPTLTTFLQGVASTLTHLNLMGRLQDMELYPNGDPFHNSQIDLSFPTMERLEHLRIERSDAFGINLKQQHANFPVLKILILPKLAKKYIPRCAENEYWVIESVSQFGLAQYIPPNRETANVFSAMLRHFPNLSELSVGLDMREIMKGYNGQQFHLVSIFHSIACSKVTTLHVLFEFELKRPKVGRVIDRSDELDRASRVMNHAMELLLPSLEKVSKLSVSVSYPTKPDPGLKRNTVLAILRMKSLVALAFKNFKVDTGDKELLQKQLFQVIITTDR